MFFFFFNASQLAILFQQTIDAFGMVAGNAVSTSVQAAYSETFKNIIIPSFERATRALMDQVYDAFQNGIGECKTLTYLIKNKSSNLLTLNT